MNTRESPGNPSERFRVYDARSFGSAIRHFRTNAGFTQAQLADLAGIERSYLSRLENGLETEQLRRLLALLRRLKLRITIEPADW